MSSLLLVGKMNLALKSTSMEEIVCGVFTQALVTFLDRELDTTNLTYSSLLNRLPPLERQHPQCSSKNRTCALFGGLVGHPVTFGLSYHDGKYRAEAGKIHGVVKGTLFAIHTLANDTATNLESLVFEAVLIFPHSCILRQRSIDVIKFEIPTGARVSVSSWRQGDKVLKVFIGSPHDGVQSIEDIFSLVDFESADLVIHCTGEGTLQFERLDPLMSKYAPVLCNISTEPSLSKILQGVSHFNFHIYRCNSKEPLQPHVKVILHRLTQSNPNQVLEQPIYAPDGHIDIILITERENTVFASSKATADINGPFYRLTVTNESGRDLFPYLFYFDPSDYSIQPLYHPPCPTMEAPLAPVHATNRSSKLKVGYGEANVEALQFSLANNITKDVGFLKLFMSSTYVDMTGLKQESLLHGVHGRGFKMRRPPPESLWDTWTYVIKTVETAG
ncbi:hypothetical protein PILCRDRAFT_13733 [Piloderma croceum F 1598]|uniref:Uncharacterized protein n=1 Tax=Piloderma croceum (strain F 1598) TaxID=765440 RepID=A0A0C3F5M5_PILCF|nr:hypothetical protein PILCRDRAFT_13733 [Piloderma croceum F 1598]